MFLYIEKIGILNPYTLALYFLVFLRSLYISELSNLPNNKQSEFSKVPLSVNIKYLSIGLSKLIKLIN